MVVNEFIGLDVGKSRTGFSRGNNAARLAEALKTVPTEDAIEEILNIGPDKLAGIVVGLPRSLSGEETEQTAWVRAWVDQAKTKIPATFYWQDEALTSKLAEAQATGQKVKDIDSLAAQIILQDFLDSAEPERVVA